VHLKSLELCGFKSFADRTKVVFERGLTAIVGPNGCGKSNIVDAIRWALGEQSARTLRGGAMQDVIFNGGGRRGPLGMAEVTLAFENEDRLLGLERDEVRVTRRLYRSGESEYELNGKACRLRDIRELLLDTGAGATAATFVEQGKIDALLHASPEERRHVLEEAAGIGRYKIRKKEALDRLEEVSQDRARLGDVLAEVIARHEEVKRQAEKAARWKDLRDRYREVRLLAARVKRAALEKKADDAKSRAARLAEERARLEAAAAALAAASDALAEEKRGRERAMREAELELRDLAAAIDGRKRQAEHEARRAAECQDDLAREERAREALEGKARSLEKEIQAGRAAAAAQERDEQGLGKRLDALEARVRDLDARAAAAQAALDTTRRDLLARLQAESQLKNRLAELDARARVLAGREDRLARKRAEVAAALAEREAQAQALTKSAEEDEARATALEADWKRAAAARDDAEKAIRAAEEAFLEQRRKANEVEARIAALASLDREGADLEPGVRAVLEAGGPDVLGPLGDALALSREHAAAIEAALGPRAQAVLVRTRESAIGIARWLAKAGKGRAELIPLDAAAAECPAEPLAPAISPATDRLLRENGFLGWAADLARPNDLARPLVARLLARTAVARDLDAALALATLPAVTACVTLAGDRVAAGAIEAGKRRATSRIERRSELQELDARREEGAKALAARRADLERLRDAEKTAAAEAERLRGEHHEARLRAFGAKKGREELDRGLARLREEERLTAAEFEEVAQDRTETKDGLAEAETRLAEERAQAHGLDAAAAERAATLRAVEVDRAGAREELQDLKVRLARGAEQWEALRRAAARAERELEENRRSRDALAADTARTRERLTESRGAADRLMAEALKLSDERAGREAKLAEITAAVEADAKALAARRAEEAEAHAARERAQAGLAQAESAERDARVRLEELAARVRDDLGVDLASLPPPPEAPAAPKKRRARGGAESGPAGSEGADATAPAAEGESAPASTRVPTGDGEDPKLEASLDREAGALRRQMEEIGAVNLEALDECEKLDERRRFLGEQVADLERAEENLRATVRKINETSRKRFLETFEAVRENFRDIFRRLFGGGKADLVLEDGKDVLEAGVDVLARPPGKEARTISLLSGGEKTLATVALLFAVFRAKPGPFCILDEVDAALDEHNVGRFVGIVRDFLDRSQFLIVSHNKRTMAAADALYGVTMPEPGVSAPVSVRLGPAGQAAAASGAAGAPATAGAAAAPAS
jgi:chromosome segregation protein